MAVNYKQKCSMCRTNYVMVTYRDRYPVCYECQKKEFQGEIKDPEMRKMFDIPEELYQRNNFLRNIKINYLRYGKLSEKQVEAFKKVVKKLSK